jgi:hypothetical protein
MSNQTKSRQHRERELARREKKELRRQLKAARREERRKREPDAAGAPEMT